MHSQISFTGHGSKRLWSRTGVHNLAIEWYLSEGLAVLFKQEPGSNRTHWVIWDDDSKNAFSVVIDEATGEVVTVLNDWYKGRLAIGAPHSVLAKSLIQLAGSSDPSWVDAIRTNRTGGPTHLRIRYILGTPVSTKTLIIRVKVAIPAITNTGQPWNDPIASAKAWDELNKQFPKLNRNIIVEQVLLKVGNFGPSKSFRPRTELQRLSL